MHPADATVSNSKPKTYSNPTDSEGVQLLCSLWIYRGCGEDSESQPAVLWRFQLPKHFLKTCLEITTATLGYSITTLFCQRLPTYLHFFYPSHLPPASQFICKCPGP